MNRKKVVLVLVDSLMFQPLLTYIQSGNAPALKFLFDKGRVYEEFISAFPTMSVTINSTLLTGVYSDQHHLPGLVWYHPTEGRIIDLGSSNRAFLTVGPKRYIIDTVGRLNQELLNPSFATIHEELASMGYTTGSINEFLFRGKLSRHVTFPKLLSFLGISPDSLEVYTPHLFTYGLFYRYPNLKINVKYLKKLGFNNTYSVDILTHLIKEKRLPDFTIVYLPDLDKDIHKHGPKSINKYGLLEQNIRQILSTYHTWEQTIDNLILIVMGDSGQTAILPDRKVAAIDLDHILSPLPIAPANKSIRHMKAVAVGHNERMVYLYSLHKEISVHDLIEKLSTEERIDLIAWKDQEIIHVMQGGTGKKLQYQKGGSLTDSYQQTWTLSGDPTILDLTIDPKNHQIKYGSYPDGLERLRSVFYSHDGVFVVATAKPGYEFKQGNYPLHLGGAGHGSLHQQDSLAPFIICGTDQSPKSNRMVDLKSFFISLVIYQ